MSLAVPDSHITDYERAVCYYTLPRVISPFTVGLLVAYVICVLEAAGALAYGLYADDPTWTTVGAWALGGIIVFGMVAFSCRALLNDWRRRMALAAARGTPQAMRDDEIPDPFAHHVLLARPSRSLPENYACVDSRGEISYSVETKRYNTHWRVSDLSGDTTFDLLAARHPGFIWSSETRLGVYLDKKKISEIVYCASLRGGKIRIFMLHPAQEQYLISEGCIYREGRMVGRIYSLRGHLYLDVESVHLNPGILACFAVRR